MLNFLRETKIMIVSIRKLCSKINLYLFCAQNLNIGKQLAADCVCTDQVETK